MEDEADEQNRLESENIASVVTTGDADSEEAPHLKFRPLAGDFQKAIRSDLISAALVTEKHLILGSHNGLVYLFDADTGSEIRKVRLHRASVTDLCTDSTGTVVASSSLDGNVVVQSKDGTETSAWSFPRPIKTVSLDPEYAKAGTKRIVSGGASGHLILSEKGWLGNKENRIYSVDGSIYTSTWMYDVIAWTDDTGLRLIHAPSLHKIGYVERRIDTVRADLNRSQLVWADANTLLCGWDDYITTVKLTCTNTKQPYLKVEYARILQIDGVICSLLPIIDSQHILVLVINDGVNVETDSSGEKSSKVGQNRLGKMHYLSPELRIISPDHEEISCDKVDFKSHAHIRSTDFCLDKRPGTDIVYAVAPKDILIVEKRDVNERIAWLIERDYLARALQLISESGTDMYDIEKTTPELATRLANAHLQLIAQNKPSEMLPFLKSFSRYSLDLAERICLENDFIDELVYIYTRMGNSRQALLLILNKFNNIPRAIEFVHSQADDQLWDDILNYSMINFDNMQILIENIGTFIHPTRILQRLPNDFCGEGLKDAVLQWFKRYEMQRMLTYNVTELFSNDVLRLSGRVRKQQKAGLSFNVPLECSLCGLPFNLFSEDDLVGYYCRHMYHRECILMNLMEEGIEVPRGLTIADEGFKIGEKVIEAALLKPFMATGCIKCSQKEQDLIRDQT